MMNRSINIIAWRLLLMRLKHFQPIKTTAHKVGVKSVAIIVFVIETVTAAIAVLLFDTNKSPIFCILFQSKMLYSYSY